MNFRAWDKKNNKMLVTYGDEGYCDQDSIYDTPWGTFCYAVAQMVGCEDYILMQSTGLEDKNGREIFEGDIVKISEVLGKVDFITDIYFDRGAFRYRHDDGSGSVLEMLSTSKVKGYESITQDIEVIGNIYENPELLKINN